MAYNIEINLQDFRDFVDHPNGGEEELQIIVEGYLDNGRHLGIFDDSAGAIAVLNNYIATNELNEADYQGIITEIEGQSEYIFDLPLVHVPAPAALPAAPVPAALPLPQVPEQPEVPDVAPAAGGLRKKRRKRRKRSKSGKRKTSKGGSRRVRKRSNRKGRNPKSRKSRKTRKTRTRRTRRTRRNRKRR